MTHKEYNDSRRWIIQDDENPITKAHFESCRVGDELGNRKPITFNKSVTGDIKVGDYVFASHWSDCDPQDPWHVGKVTEVGDGFVVVGDVSKRRWRRATRITPKKGRKIIDWFRYRG